MWSTTLLAWSQCGTVRAFARFPRWHSSTFGATFNCSFVHVDPIAQPNASIIYSSRTVTPVDAVTSGIASSSCHQLKCQVSTTFQWFNRDVCGMDLTKRTVTNCQILWLYRLSVLVGSTIFVQLVDFASADLPYMPRPSQASKRSAGSSNNIKKPTFIIMFYVQIQEQQDMHFHRNHIIMWVWICKMQNSHCFLPWPP